jgi:23S rRNA (uracil1939-C5)-methyltransferase
MPIDAREIVRFKQIADGGAGVGRLLNGKTVFAPFAAPGDLAQVKIVKEAPHWAMAEIEKLVEEGPARISPFCPFSNNWDNSTRCGGCNMQHIAYPAQLEEKKNVIKSAFIHLGGIKELPEISVHVSPQRACRNRMQFHADGKTGVGLKQWKKNGLIPINCCPIADDGINERLQEGALTPVPGLERFNVYSYQGLFLQEGLPPAKGRVNIAGKKLQTDVRLFFQSNAAMLEKLGQDLAGIAEEAAASRPQALMADLYAGVGTMSVLAGDAFKKIDLIEENARSLEMAEENCAGKTGRRFFALSDQAWAERQTHAPGLEPYAFAIADPPRGGFSSGLSAWFVQSGPPVLAYVSCNPATQARDAKILINGGYSLEKVSFYDFYPHTSHIESLAVFRRAKA